MSFRDLWGGRGWVLIWLHKVIRYLFSCVYLFIAIGAFMAMPNALRSISLSFWGIIAMTYSLCAPTIFIVTCWSLFRNNSSHRYWVIAGSLLNLVFVFPLVFRNSFPRSSLAYVVVGVLGLVYCALPGDASPS